HAEAALDAARGAQRGGREVRRAGHAVEGGAALFGRAAEVLGRDGARLDVGDGADLEDRPRRPGARHAAPVMGAVDAREAYVIVELQLPRGRRVVGLRPHLLAVLVAI